MEPRLALRSADHDPFVWPTRSFRLADVEVDIVVEDGARARAGVEVKAAVTVTAADFRGLRKLREAAAKRWAAGMVLYDGEVSASCGDGLFAVPVRALWETG